MEHNESKSFRDLLVWKQAMQLAKDSYLLTREFPKAEMFGMTSQIRRAATSVPANIAEGSGRGSRKDFQQFLRIAQGSLRELETYLLLCPEVELTTPEQVQPLLMQLASAGKLLRALIQSLETKTIET